MSDPIRVWLHKVDGITSLAAYRYADKLPDDLVADLKTISIEARRFAQTGMLVAMIDNTLTVYEKCDPE